MSGAARRVGEAALPGLLKRGEPAEDHLPGVEHGRRFRLADHAATNRARCELNLSLPTRCALGTGGELGTSETPGGCIQRRDDVPRGLWIRRLPALACEIGVPDEAEGA